MTTLADFLKTRFMRNARGPDVYDCWGLVIAARAALFRCAPLPPMDGVRSGDVRGMTRAVEQVAALNALRPVAAPRPGAIATAWRGSLCPHVGLVVEADGQLRVLDTDETTGPRLMSVRRFCARFARVVFYDDAADNSLPHWGRAPDNSLRPWGRTPDNSLPPWGRAGVGASSVTGEAGPHPYLSPAGEGVESGLPPAGEGARP